MGHFVGSTQTLPSAEINTPFFGKETFPFIITIFLCFTFLVGSPIPVEKVESPSEEQINELHSEYTRKLKELFDKHRDACGVPNYTELVIQ